MFKSRYSIVGIMSGSSVDGLDLCICNFQLDDLSSPPKLLDWGFQKTLSVEFPASLASQLKNATDISAKELVLLNAAFGQWLGHQVNAFLKNETQPDFIASHGHTIFHYPAHRTTLQIGCGAQIAAITGLPTITDFRKADMANGGVGAPFAPMADLHLFPDYDFYINMGGIANITNLLSEDGISAWDICPFNQLLNHLAQQVNQPFDHSGEISRLGKIIQSLIDQLHKITPIKVNQPHGLDNQFVAQNHIKLLDNFQASVEDKLATCVHFINEAIVQTIAKIIQENKIKREKPLSLFATGGGAFNTYLIQQLSKLLEQENVFLHIPSPEIVNFKEAALMALLGLHRITNNPTSFPTVTGANTSSIGGVIHASNKNLIDS